MGKRENETIRLRNEGMAYALRLAKREGLEELERQVRARGLLRVSIKYTGEELQQSYENLSENVYNNMLTIVYAVLHDRYGFGKKRLTEFKEHFDDKVYGIGERDEMGHHWARFSDYAKEANELYDFGIDLENILRTEKRNDENEDIYIKAESAVRFLKKHKFEKAADALQEEVFGGV